MQDFAATYICMYTEQCGLTGCFSAICDGHVVSIQVPHDTYPGDTIQIGVSRNMSSSGNEGGNKEDSEVTREAAKLFLRYDVDKENSISVSELRAMLQNEFQIDDESIRIESELSGVRADDPLTFDEFCSWYYALMVRLHVYKHMQKMKSAMEDVADQGLQQVKENEGELLWKALFGLFDRSSCD